MKRALLVALAVALAVPIASAAPADALPRVKWPLTSGVGFRKGFTLADGDAAIIDAGNAVFWGSQLCLRLQHPTDESEWFFNCWPVEYRMNLTPPWTAYASGRWETDLGTLSFYGYWRGTTVPRPDPYVYTTYSLIRPVVAGAFLRKNAKVSGTVTWRGRTYSFAGHPGYMAVRAPE